MDKIDGGDYSDDAYTCFRNLADDDKSTTSYDEGEALAGADMNVHNQTLMSQSYDSDGDDYPPPVSIRKNASYHQQTDTDNNSITLKDPPESARRDRNEYNDVQDDNDLTIPLKTIATNPNTPPPEIPLQKSNPASNDEQLTEKELELQNNHPHGHSLLHILYLTFVTTLGGILSGYHLAITGMALPSLTHTLHLQSAQSETIAGTLFLGGAFGCIFGGTLCDYFGRKRSILIVDGIFLLGGIIASAASTLAGVVLGRIVTGFAMTYSAVANVAYLTEMAPSDNRGGMVSANELSTSVGVLVAYIVGYAVAREEEEGYIEEVKNEWRIMFGCPGLLALLQCQLMWNMPESKVWEETKRMKREKLNSKGGDSRMLLYSKDDEYGLNRVDVDGGENWLETEQVHEQKERDGDGLTAYLDYIIRKSSENETSLPDVSPIFYKRAVIVTMFMSVAQQTCGHVNILNFAPDIFAEVIGFTHEEEEGNSTILVPILFLGGMKLIITAWVIWEVDTGLGRRKLLLFGLSIIAFSLFLLICAFAGVPTTDTPLTLSQKILTIIGTAGVVIGYAASYGPLTYVITSELFPACIRGRALGFSEVVTSTCAYFISYTFLTGQEMFSPVAPYVLYFFSALWSLIFAIIAVPDTGVVTFETGPEGAEKQEDHEDIDENEVDLEEVEKEMERMWLWRPKPVRKGFNGAVATVKDMFTMPSDEELKLEMSGPNRGIC
mmetsp:Transcript_30074/g.36722  ORF Transcript_30074/g.36722 Transcript_30074/m.36722 type:complete len:722 (+) Transcript_30074:45-2210(+)|eukprot:CAMPEP_0172510994 /NCGR_PEP_ID=MMETSP1066-20121228/232857_1 /TAXON_ID=671091 /ORGANISM="Coscinodiscus wailesii, Strain CCMP2513" /LENGTH=721 /DNA_ID=CAMNT_0013290179 /DNA_START=38 /DNA_END=2203 /DNA_ORIENTATION=-